MKKSFVIAVLFLISCKPVPEFYINGKAYYTEKNCLKSHIEPEAGYSYGINPSNGNFGMVFGVHNSYVCDLYIIDTIEIKQNK